MSTTKTTYSFPILTNDEIRSCLKELKIELSERDLLRPTHESLRHVYESAYELFFNVNLDEDESFQPDPEIAEEVGMGISGVVRRRDSERFVFKSIARVDVENRRGGFFVQRRVETGIHADETKHVRSD